MKKDTKYSYQINLQDKNSTHGLISDEIKNNSSILELGCDSGYFLQALQIEKNCHVFGLDYNEKAINLAQKQKLSVKKADFNIDKINKFEKQKYDYILLVDLLEHLNPPAQNLIKQFKNILKKNGQVIISVPNINHVDVISLMLTYGFGYLETGLLDKTHLHFYSSKELITLMWQHGFVCDKIKTVLVPPGYTRVARPETKYQIQLKKVVDICNPKTNFVYQYIYIFRQRKKTDTLDKQLSKLAKTTINLNSNSLTLVYPVNRIITVGKWLLRKYLWEFLDKIKNLIKKS